MSFFLAIPVAALLWAVACFSVALIAYGVQGPSLQGNLFVAVVAGIAVLTAAATAVVSRHAWHERRRIKGPGV